MSEGTDNVLDASELTLEGPDQALEGSDLDDVLGGPKQMLRDQVSVRRT